MQRSRWLIGAIASLLGALALGQVPGTIPPIKLPPTKLPAKSVPGMAEAIEAQRPFVMRYAFCNSMQLYESRRAIWEPIYQDAGASAEQIEDYRRNLVLFFKDFCAERPGPYWPAALEKLQAFDAMIDERNARAFGIAIADATRLRLGRIAAALEDFRRQCLMESSEDTALAQAQDLKTIFGSVLPASTAPPGMSLDRQSAGVTFGRCKSPGGSGSGPSLKTDERSLSACIQNALSQADTCDSPVSEGPRGNVVETTRLGRSHTIADGVAIVTTGEMKTYANGAREVIRRTTISWADSRDQTRTVDVEDRVTIGTDGEVSRLRAVEVDGEPVEVSFESNEDRPAIRDRPGRPRDGDPHVELNSGTFHYHEVAVKVGHVMAGYTTVTHRGTAGRRDCQSVNPGSATPVGLARMMNTSGTAAPFRAGRLDTLDLMGQCMCTSLGRFGPQLAHQYGFSCGPDANSARLDCLLNPRGPADGIRPECVEFLHADNPDRDTPRALNEWCGRVAQCPPGAGFASMAPATGVAMCSCSTGLAAPRGGSGGTPGGGRCAAVSCAGGAGAAGSDLYRQCCGAPGELPLPVEPTPGSPVPRPGGPGELPKQPLPAVPKLPLPEMPKQPLPPK